MDFIQVLTLIAVIVGVLFIILWILSAIYRRGRKSALDSEDLTPGQELHSSLTMITFRGNLITRRYFPLGKNERGTPETYVLADEVVISRGGILVITVFKYGGKIINERDDVWLQITDDTRFELKPPRIRSERVCRALHEVLAESGYRDVPVYPVILLTDKTAYLTLPTDDIIQFSELEKLFRDLNALNKYGITEQFYIRRAIKRCAKTKQELQK